MTRQRAQDPRSRRYRLAIALAAALLAVGVSAASAGAATFTVTSTGNSGAGTLRQAITDANATVAVDAIEFNLSGSAVTPTSALPTVTQPVTIDGTTDPVGSAAIDGTSAGTLASGLSISAAGSTVKGIEISNFAVFGIVVDASDAVIAANQLFGNGTTGGGGISIASGTGSTIGGADGGNQITENTGPGIAIASNGNVVAGGNAIGDFGAGNSGAGVAITGSASENTIGGVVDGDGNAIIGNGGAGVAVSGTGNANAIIGNQLASNDGLGIDLGTADVTANDTGDGDTGANDLQNFPLLTNLSTAAGDSTVTGTLNSVANTDFRIDFYSTPQCDESGNGEGDTYVGSSNVHTDTSGDANFNPTFPEIFDRFVTATATGPGNTGSGSTSEFSGCLAGPPTGGVISNGTVQLGVNNTGDLNYACTMEEPGCPGESAAGTGPVGLRYVPSNLDSTAPGCPCEGWGMADVGSGLTGYANESAGTANVTVNSFTRSGDGTTAIADVTISDPAKPNAQMHVVQDYHPSAASPNLYENTVTVTNTGTVDFTDLRYRRVMDWDVEPTAFSEWSTIHGTSPQLLFDSDDGFATADPLGERSYLSSESVCGAAYTGACAFTDLGANGVYPTETSPSDHGALFDFGFGALAHNASKTFKVYYGAAPTENAALNALDAGGAQVYSLGESDCPNGGGSIAGCDGLATGAGPLEGKPATFMFGFVTTTGDLSITKTDSPDPVIVNQDLTYTLTIHNNGPEAAAGVTVDDTLPAGVTFKSATPSAGGSCNNASPVKCTFAAIANNSTATITIVVTPTQVGGLSNTATVTSASSDAVPGNNSSTQTTTVNSASPQASIDDVSKTEGDTGTSNMTFTVTLSPAPTGTVTVDYATANGTATQPADYTSTSGTATFSSGETTKTIDVPIVGDVLDEENETLLVNLSNPSGVSITDGQGTGTILDDDGPPTVSIADAQLTEGNSGTSPMHLAVTLSQASGRTVSVQYATGAGGDTATSGADYTGTSGTLTFDPGQTTKNVDVPIVGDTIDELDETFAVTLSSPTNVTINDGTGIGTILDDDDPPTLSIADGSVAEGSSGTASLPLAVSLSRASGKTVTVHYATGALADSATAGVDYTSTSGTLTFNPGVTTRTIDVGVLGDTVDEPDETLTVTLDTPVSATLADAVGIGTILDDDGPAIAVDDVAVTEGNSGTTPATFTVSLSAVSAQSVTVHYATSDGTATAPSDYVAAAGDLTFAPGETSKTVTVTVNGDTVVEADETLHVDLSAATKATLADAQGLGTISDDDVAPAGGTPPTIAVTDATVSPEGNSGTKAATFTVTLSAAATSTVTVHFATTDGTATAGVDYSSTSGTLTFAPGEIAKTFTAAVIGDTVPEPDETFAVTLSAPVNATIADGAGVGTIVDDDDIGTPGSVGSGDLFCGVQHRGKCKGIPVKDEFDRPGNAVWTFDAYNPPPGKVARATAAKRIRLGKVTRKVKAGRIRFVFKLKAGAKTKRLYRKVLKAKLKSVLLTRTFTPAAGPPQIQTARIRLKR